MLGDERQQSSARTAPSRPSRPQSLICSSRTAYTPAAVAISIISFNKFYKSADLVRWTNNSICARSAKKSADLAHEKFTTTNNSSIYKMTSFPTCMKTSRPGTQPKQLKRPKNTAKKQNMHTHPRNRPEQALVELITWLNIVWTDLASTQPKELKRRKEPKHLKRPKHLK